LRGGGRTLVLPDWHINLPPIIRKRTHISKTYCRRRGGKRSPHLSTNRVMPPTMNPHVHEVWLSLYDLIKPAKVYLRERIIHSGSVGKGSRDKRTKTPSQAAARSIQRRPRAQVESHVHEWAIGDTPASGGTGDSEGRCVRGNISAVPSEAREGIP